MIGERTIVDPISKIDVMMFLHLGNTSDLQSVSDIPLASDYIKIVLNGRRENFKESGTYYVYEMNSKYYVEKPYERIIEITYEDYIKLRTILEN